MLYFALVLILGHNIIPHHHHDYVNNSVEHHHDYDNENNSDSGNESDDWSHLFSGIQHGSDGLTFLTNHSSSDNLPKKISSFYANYVSTFILNQIIFEVRQNAPPYISDYYNSQSFLPSGLRAPPIFFV